MIFQGQPRSTSPPTTSSTSTRSMGWRLNFPTSILFHCSFFTGIDSPAPQNRGYLFIASLFLYTRSVTHFTLWFVLVYFFDISWLASGRVFTSFCLFVAFFFFASLDITLWLWGPLFYFYIAYLFPCLVKKPVLSIKGIILLCLTFSALHLCLYLDNFSWVTVLSISSVGARSAGLLLFNEISKNLKVLI